MANFLWVYGVLLDGVATFMGTVGKQLLRYAALPGKSVWYYPLGLFFTGFIDPIFDTAAYSFAAGVQLAAYPACSSARARAA